MKTAKRTLALVVTVLMLIGTCTVAATAANTLQAKIDAAGEGDTVTLTADATGSVVINKNLTLDLGGFELTGTEGQPAITIQSADVTVTNGHVYSKFVTSHTADMIGMVKDNSPAAIRVEGGSVIVDGVRAAGSFTRIPGQQTYAVPTGSAVELLDEATATICNASLVGRYGVNNKVTGQQAGGTVTIEDGILIGFMRAVKDSSKEVLSGAEKVNAADRIEGFLNSSYKLEERERRLMKQVFAERAFVYTQSVNDEAAVMVTECADGTPLSAVVTAHEDVSNLWDNNTSTDCSYKYVPEYAILADGTLVKLEKDGEDYTAEIDPAKAEDVTIKYRLEFEMQPDVKRWATDFDGHLEAFYNWAVGTADELYAKLCEKYDKYVGIANEVFVQVDELGVMPVGDNKLLADTNEYKRMVHLLLDLGGETMYFGGDMTQHFSDSQLEYFYGDENYSLDEGEYYGVLDHVAEMKATFEALRGETFADQSKWADLGYWLYENYPTVIEMIDDAAEKVGALQDALSTDMAQAALQEGGLSEYQETLDKIATVLGDVQDVIEMLLGSHTIDAVLAKLENNKAEIKPYINKMIYIYNNHASYFTPEKYVDGDFAKAYSVRGGTEIYPETVDQGVLWAGYEDQIDDVELDKGEKPQAEQFAVYVIARKGANTTPLKIQLRDPDIIATRTFQRNHPCVTSITEVTYEGALCELWTINRGVPTAAGTYAAIAKYNNVRPINSIPNEEGAFFDVEGGSASEFDTTVYKATVENVDPELGYVVFDGKTPVTITVVTGKDVEKVQFFVDNVENVTLTYNRKIAKVEESQLEDGTPVLVWTIQRLFPKYDYKYSINTRSVLGLVDSGKDIRFKVADKKLTDDEKLISVTGEGADNYKAVFTVYTSAGIAKVRFTNVDAHNTITVDRNNSKAVVTEQADGTLKWVITINHMACTATYDVQAFDEAYTAPKQVTVTVTAPAE